MVKYADEWLATENALFVPIGFHCNTVRRKSSGRPNTNSQYANTFPFDLRVLQPANYASRKWIATAHTCMTVVSKYSALTLVEMKGRITL
jgi:hypothetical protein